MAEDIQEVAVEEAEPQAEVERLAQLAAQVAELQSMLEEKEGLVAALEEEVRQRDEEIEELRGQLAHAVAAYRVKALAEAPEVPQDMVSGETVDEVDRALSAARELVERVRRQMRERSAAERIPAGAPARRGQDLSALSAAEKIAYGLSRRQGS